MDTVTFDGVEYTKATELARDFKYTSDYIGQLCRAKKVDARLVGRAWYVNRDSLLKHQESRHQTADSERPADQAVEKKIIVNSPDNDTAIKTKPQRLKVYPTITNKAVKQLASTRENTEENRSKLTSVSYQTDAESLFPDTSKVTSPGSQTMTDNKPISTEIKIIKPTDATQTSQNRVKHSINKSIHSPQTRKEEKPASNSASHSTINRTVIENKPVLENLTPSTRSNQSTSSVRARSSTQPADSVDSVHHKSKKGVKVVNFAPESVVGEQFDKRPSTAVSLSPLIATLLAVVVVTALFSASITVTADQLSYQSQVNLQVANLLEILNY